MNAIGEKIKYLPSSEYPLSADVYFIEGDKYCYIYDVGNNDDSLNQINQIKKEKIIVLSHYHQDHIGNIENIDYYHTMLDEIDNDDFLKLHNLLLEEVNETENILI